MMRWTLPIIAGFAVVSACHPAREAPPQPIPFDHALHLAVSVDDTLLQCPDCHTGAERGVHAGLPPLSYCLRCHMRPQGDPPFTVEQLVRDYAASPEPFHWIQVTRNEGHVYFSHRAHVALAGMECADCHGDVAAWRRPPTKPNERLKDMDACISCHRERGASIQCGACHQ